MSCYGSNANSFFSSGDLCQAPRGHGLVSDPPNSAAATPSVKRDPGGIGFVDEIGGRVDGFICCTESLGFESSDERSADAGSSIGELEGRHGGEMGSSMRGRRPRERSVEKRTEVEFPPPLTSLNQYGQRSFVLQPLRRDGRLELTEVKIHRPEVLFASRENGRLILSLVRNLDDEEDEVAEEEEERTEEYAGDEEESKVEEEEKREGEDGEDCGGWRSPVSGGEGGEALRRCYDYESARHQHLHVWSPRCVTTM